MLATLVLLAASAFIRVSAPVSALQVDIDTPSTPRLVSTITDKQLSMNRLPNGLMRVLVFGLNQTTFTGQFLIVDMPLTSISNTTLSNPNGTVSTATLAIDWPPAAPTNTRTSP